jgi:hypothetical protein
MEYCEDREAVKGKPMLTWVELQKFGEVKLKID